MDLISLSMAFFSKKRFKRVYCFLEGVRITFYKISKEVFAERCKSPTSFAPSRFKIRSRSRMRKEYQRQNEYKKDH